MTDKILMFLAGIISVGLSLLIVIKAKDKVDILNKYNIKDKLSTYIKNKLINDLFSSFVLTTIIFVFEFYIYTNSLLSQGILFIVLLFVSSIIWNLLVLFLTGIIFWLLYHHTSTNTFDRTLIIVLLAVIVIWLVSIFM